MRTLTTTTQGALDLADTSTAQQPLPWCLIKNYLNANQQALLWHEAQQYRFEQPSIKVYGKTHPIPRQQVWFGALGCDYLYADLMIQAQPLPYYAQRLAQQLSREYQQDFNGVLVNRYRTGEDKMGWHSDDEPELVPHSSIASLTLGASRDFDIRHKQTGKQYRLCLESGDLLIMHWPMQRDWQHALPQRKALRQTRLNYTYRCLLPNYHTQ